MVKIKVVSSFGIETRTPLDVTWEVCYIVHTGGGGGRESWELRVLCFRLYAYGAFRSIPLRLLWVVGAVTINIGEK
jgi:hypothetical protein